jgi:hypothetical protein
MGMTVGLRTTDQNPKASRAMVPLERRRICAIVALWVVGSCGGAPSPRPIAVRPLGDPRFPIVPMRLEPTEGAHGPTRRIDLELRSDGSLYWRSELAGQIVGDRLLRADGRELLAAPLGAAVRTPGRRRSVQLLDDGALIFDGSERVYFDEHGRVVHTRGGQPPHWMNLRLSGLRPATVRTGALVLLFAMIRSERL